MDGGLTSSLSDWILDECFAGTTKAVSDKFISVAICCLEASEMSFSSKHTAAGFPPYGCIEIFSSNFYIFTCKHIQVFKEKINVDMERFILNAINTYQKALP